jgi:hypothetical protein
MMHIKTFFTIFFSCSAISINAADPQQEINPKQNRDKYTLDIDTARKKIRETQRWQDTHQTLNGLNFSYRQGFKPIAVLEYASVMVDTSNAESKDNKPFNFAGKHHPDSRGASWCKFCDQKMKSVKAGSTKSEDVEDFFVLCGYPLASQIIDRNQSTHYSEFLKTVAKAKKQYMH